MIFDSTQMKICIAYERSEYIISDNLCKIKQILKLVGITTQFTDIQYDLLIELTAQNE